MGCYLWGLAGCNGGWFRNPTAGSNFWTGFYTELLDAARDRKDAVQPTYIHDHINHHGVFGEVKINTGAWNTGWHNGIDFIQWTGSQKQKDALSKLKEVSQAIHDARKNAVQMKKNAEYDSILEQAMWRLLRAETSCNFYWGEAWVDRCHRDLDAAMAVLEQCRTI